MEGPKHPGHTGIVPGEQVRVVRERRVVGPAHDHASGEPEVILIRDGDTIKAIEVICSCGKKTRLNCVF
ncbi:MAG: hypothetical protein U0793_13395 [Gemmataceae bacterium]